MSHHDEAASSVPKSRSEPASSVIPTAIGQRGPMRSESFPAAGATRMINTADAMAKLKEQAGGDLLIYGSSTLVNMLLPRKLIDEYRFMLYPLVLGTESGSSKTATTRQPWRSSGPRPRAAA
jgi:riboflavin biosynthesis pyrimidine reductase